MATASTLSYSDNQAARVFEKCRKVGITFASVDDADTYVAGPQLMACAWESTTTNTGEVHWRITDRTTGTVEADCASNGRAGTLWLFYGTSGRAV